MNSTPLLTTICPVWGRADALDCYLEAIGAAAHPLVQHLILFVGETPLDSRGNVACVGVQGPPQSIGQYHNMGARLAQTEWIMKSDVDALPHTQFFEELLPVLETARPREWFNAGFLYVNRGYSHKFLIGALEPESYFWLMAQRQIVSDHAYSYPQGSQFICRRQEYLDLGGALSGFKGWGWEDYQQLYMLEQAWKGEDPLPGALDLSNVTRRCRDEISRRAAMELWTRNPWLCLLHRWHARASGSYRSCSERNRKLLLDYILSERLLRTATERRQ